MGVNHRDFGTFCCICFNGLTVEDCAVDLDGIKWDVCKAEDCAELAGIEEDRNDGNRKSVDQRDVESDL